MSNVYKEIIYESCDCKYRDTLRCTADKVIIKPNGKCQTYKNKEVKSND